MKRKYATKKELNEVMDRVLALAKSVSEMAKWQAYHSIKNNVCSVPQKMREEILEGSKGHITHLLFTNLFSEYPLAYKTE